MNRGYIGALCISGSLTWVAGCGGSQPPLAAPGTMLQSRPIQGQRAAQSPIRHVVVLVQEGRTFNDLFATATVGKERVGHGKHARTVSIKLREVGLSAKGPAHTGYSAYLESYRDGHMDGFNIANGLAPYQYVKPSDIKTYYTLAADWAIADRMFQTQGSGDFTAHQDLIRGGTEIDRNDSLIDSPSSSSAWGCDSPAGTKTPIVSNDHYSLSGPFPCTTNFPSPHRYKTLADLLDAHNVSWRYYTPPFQRNAAGALWNAFDVIASVRFGSEWGTNVSWPETNIFSDIANQQLPAMSWVIPSALNSDYPGLRLDNGPAWVASVINAIGESSYWDSTAVIVIWNNWGGYYDPIAPPKLDNQGGLGFRVPMILVSPYVPQGEVSHTAYAFGSILRFVEDNWQLGRLGTTDRTARSIRNMFDFRQPPRVFIPVSS